MDRDSISYLLIQITKSHRNKVGKRLMERGLHVGQDILLVKLGEKDGMTQSELAEQLGVEPATVTKMLKRMETAGLILRKSDAVDARKTRVHLTESGRSAISFVSDTWDNYETIMTKGLSVEEKVLLRRLLLQLLQDISKSD